MLHWVELGMESLLNVRDRSLAKRNLRFLAQLVERFFFLRYNPRPRRVLEEGTELRGEDYLREALREGRGALLVTAHLGNFPWIFTYLAQRFPFHVVMRRLKSPSLEGLLRESLELASIRRILPQGASLRVKSALQRGGVVTYLVDQYLLPLSSKRRSEAVRRAIPLLASSLGVPVLPLFVYQGAGGKVIGELRAPLETLDLEGMREMVLEEIRRNPHLWFWWWRLGKNLKRRR